MIVTHKIDMDFLSKKENAAVPQIHVVQGDCNSRMLELTLYADQVAWMIPEGTTVQIRYRKPDGTGGIYDTMPDGTRAWSIKDNTVSVLLAPQMLAVAGIVRSQVALLLSGNYLAAFETLVVVEEDPSVRTLKSEDYTNLQLWVAESVEDALLAAKRAGTFDGATFIPKVSTDGVLSWTNDKGLANPASVNINAPQGMLPVENGGTGAATAAAARSNLGAAVAGYGYGEVPSSLGSADDDTAFTASLNEQFSKTSSKTRQVRFTWGGGAWIGTLWNAGNNYGVLTAYSYAVQNVGYVIQKVVRNCVNGTWQEWEYENPPMKAGVEYRTTERYLGKPVYTKIINYGALAAENTTVSIPLGITVVTNIVDYTIMITLASGNKITFPPLSLYDATPYLSGYFSPADSVFVLQTHSDLSGAAAVVTVKYTKN